MRGVKEREDKGREEKRREENRRNDQRSMINDQEHTKLIGR
jgi:hypothetical protein